MTENELTSNMYVYNNFCEENVHNIKLIHFAVITDALYIIRNYDDCDNMKGIHPFYL